MKPVAQTSSSMKRLPSSRSVSGALLLSLLLFQPCAHASMFKGEALDNVADVMSWVVLVIAPVAAIAVFLMVHILPEKIAEKKKHPQTDAIKTLCLLSLVFGGMLWPLAWLWAYSKPVMYKLAYGSDTAEHGHDDAGMPAAVTSDPGELQRLRKQVSELESRLAGKPATGEGKA
jgi:CBS domain containing-hemolysin-like protein